MTSLLAHLPHLEVRVHPTKGRSVHVAAKDGIQRGQSLFEEMPFGGVVLSTMTQKLCAVCYQEADPDITCDDCSQVAFCSSSCQAQLQDIHDLECCALEDLDLIAKKSSADKDLLRLLARILSTRVATPTVAAPTVFSSYSDVLDMIHATEKLGTAWRAAVARGAELLVKALPKACALPIDEIVGIAARINENTYSAEAKTPHSPIATVGLFPLAGLINHSCSPNCTWSSGATPGTMVVKATEFIPHGDEVCLYYIDVNQPRAARQTQLQLTKHFTCACDRCIAPWSPTSVDTIIDGVCCAACHELYQDDSGVCSTCGASLLNASTATELKSKAAATLKQAQAQYERKQYTAVQDLLCRLDDPSNGLELHPSHWVLMSAARLLADCFFKTRDYKASYKYRCRVVESLRATTSFYSQAMASAYIQLAELLAVSMKHSVWSDGDEKTAKLAELKTAFTTGLDIRRVCYVESHPLVQQVRAQVEALK